MFENIINLFKKIGKREKIEEKSKDTAKERLHLVLMQDRANVSADFLDMMRQEIIEVIKKYIDVDEKDIDVRLTNKTNEDGTMGAPALYANIPITGIKENMKKEKETKDTASDDVKEKEHEEQREEDNNEKEEKQPQKQQKEVSEGIEVEKQEAKAEIEAEEKATEIEAENEEVQAIEQEGKEEQNEKIEYEDEEQPKEDTKQQEKLNKK